MNSIEFSLELVNEGETVNYDFIDFTKCCFVRVDVDKEPLHLKPDFEGSVIVLDELKKSVSSSGKYLIFVCACGIADDGGWEMVNVQVNDDSIDWEIERDENHSFRFKKGEFLKSFDDLIEHYERVKDRYELEPSQVVAPE